VQSEAVKFLVIMIK